MGNTRATDIFTANAGITPTVLLLLDFALSLSYREEGDIYWVTKTIPPIVAPTPR